MEGCTVSILNIYSKISNSGTEGEEGHLIQLQAGMQVDHQYMEGGESGNVHIGAQGVGGYPSYAAAPSHHHHQGGSTSWGGGGSAATFEGEEDYSNEPPLIEELGINFAHIWMKTKTIILPIKVCSSRLPCDCLRISGRKRRMRAHLILPS